MDSNILILLGVFTVVLGLLILRRRRANSKYGSVLAGGAEEQRMLCYSAMYPELDGLLGGGPNSASDFFNASYGKVGNSRNTLANSWGVQSKRDLRERVSHYWMENSAPEETTAWDAARYGQLLRLALTARYIGPSEFWSLLEVVDSHIQGRFRDWDTFAHEYLMGRRDWATMGVGEDLFGDEIGLAVRRLLEHPQSPWQSTSP